MGTRNLTVVYSESELKVAQYGQWDGYPSGTGLDILDFLRNADLEAFKEKLKSVSFFTEQKLEKEDEMGEVYDRRPYLSRDLGSDILGAILNGSYLSRGYDINKGGFYAEEIAVNVDKLVNQFDFGFDSLFCEWAYVIDLDNDNLEVYKGFQQKPVLEGRWASDEATSGVNKNYYSVNLVQTYSLDNLPTNEDFISILEPQEEDE
jgi:hypothetical protein